MITRRSALAAFAGVVLSPSLGRSAQKATAFALIGDRYHNSDYIRTGLNAPSRRSWASRSTSAMKPRCSTSETLDGYKLLIVLRDGMIWPDGYPDENTNAAWVATGKPEARLRSADAADASEAAVLDQAGAGQGGPRSSSTTAASALFLHNVTHVGLTDPDFRHVLGAAYAGHPPIRTFKVKVKNPNHPITKGVRDFVITDEQHYMEYDKDPKHIFLETVNEEGLNYQKQGATAPGGWSYDYGKGRVCYLSPGHLLTVLWNPEYIKLQQNAVRWLLRQG